MAAENHKWGSAPSVNPTNVDHSLDDLARGLARGTISRREAVRLVGAALLGGALASVPGFAWAQPERRQVPPSAECEAYCTQSFPAGPEREQCLSQCRQVPSSADCEAYCTQVFPEGPERAQCLSQGAKGSGPCYECNVTLGVWPPAGPHFPGCPPDQVFDPNPETGTCCHTCPPGSVICGAGGPQAYCLSLPYNCGLGGTFDPSTCSCSCPPGTINCGNTPGGCVDPLTDSHNCGQCSNACHGRQGQMTPCVNGVCTELNCDSNGVSCTDDSQCCSGNCEFELGVCLPPTGPNGVICTCADGTRIETCTSADCPSLEAHRLVCDPLCPFDFSTQCTQNSCLN
jgi:hypothetical protein